MHIHFTASRTRLFQTFVLQWEVASAPFAQVSAVGTRPATESLQEIRDSRLLTKIPHGNRHGSTIFSDGNRAWGSEAKRLKLRHISVNHQNKEWVRKDRKRRNGQGSSLAGTQRKLIDAGRVLKKL